MWVFTPLPRSHKASRKNNPPGLFQTLYSACLLLPRPLPPPPAAGARRPEEQSRGDGEAVGVELQQLPGGHAKGAGAFPAAAAAKAALPRRGKFVCCCKSLPCPQLPFRSSPGQGLGLASASRRRTLATRCASRSFQDCPSCCPRRGGRAGSQACRRACARPLAQGLCFPQARGWGKWPLSSGKGK